MLLLYLALSFSGVNATDDIVVVVNHSNDVSSLSKKEVIDIYMGRYLSFPNGASASPIDFPTRSVTKQQFYLLLVNQNEQEIKSYWSRLLFSGRAKPPTEADSAAGAIKLVEQKADAIAYIPRDKVTSEMKIVFQFKP